MRRNGQRLQMVQEPFNGKALRLVRLGPCTGTLMIEPGGRTGAAPGLVCGGPGVQIWSQLSLPLSAI